MKVIFWKPSLSHYLSKAASSASSCFSLHTGYLCSPITLTYMFDFGQELDIDLDFNVFETWLPQVIEIVMFSVVKFPG